MSSALLLRSFSRGGSLLLKPSRVSCMFKPDLAAKPLTLTPATSGALDYFRARRGPYTPAEKAGNHMLFTSTHWKVERIIAISMIGIMPAALFVQGPAMELVFTTTVFMHAFWSLDHVLSDYVQKFFPPIHYIWYAVSILAFAGLMHFNYNDVGVLKAISMLWRV